MTSWAQAYAELSRADGAGQLAGEDLERFATAAYMTGREAEYLELLERAHRAHLGAGDEPAALRCAFWLGVNLARRGEIGPASGWLGRARRLHEQSGGQGVEAGYLLLPRIFELEGEGDWRGAAELAAEAVAIGARRGDADLVALAGHEQGHVLVRDGRVAEGLKLLDEAMVAAASGELSPIVTGIVYCGVILACEEAHDMRRAREWTATLTRWCEAQPEMVAFTGRCSIHRAEILQWQGAWGDALAEARRAAERSLRGENRQAAGEASYREGEVLRLRGQFEAAEAAYRRASEHGCEPQPGLMRQLGIPRIPAAELDRIEVPTTLIWGRQDRANRLRIAERVSERHGWPLQVIEDCADDPPRDRPAEFLAALRPALSDAS